MVAAVSCMVILGLGAGLLLAVASRVFYVWEDPKIAAIKDALPGANCGGCGQAGCAAAAEAIAAGRVPCNVCVVGGFEVAQEVGAIMGQKIEAREPEFAWTSCRYGIGEADTIYDYDGTSDCRAAVMLYGGSKECPVGCIGLGSCIKACRFGALSMGDNNLPVVNRERCVGCGACTQACPKNIITLTSRTQRIVGEYVMDECTAPCQQACPTGINIPAFISEIRRGNDEQALRIIKEKCPLPLICGYICPAPCELKCRRGVIDEGIAINSLKRFVATHEMETGRTIQPRKLEANGHRIAVVGGGAEGLSAAFYLALLGYRPTIFEAKAELGGILRYVISKDRLPTRVLDHDIKGILNMGVEAETNRIMGQDFTAADLLRDGYDAVMLTSGGLDSRKILQPEQDRFQPPVHGLVIMLDFLASLARGERMDLGRHVVIVQSGPRALELARQCRQLGSPKVTIVSGRPLAELPVAFHDTKALRKDGLEVHPSTTVTAMGGDRERLTRIGLEYTDPRGAVPARSDITDVDTLILSAGRLPEIVFVRADGAPEDSTPAIAWQTIESFRTFQGGGGSGIFSTPEPGRVSDASAVVKALLSGRRLVRALHQYFTDGQITPLENLACDVSNRPDVAEVQGVPISARQRPAVSDVEGVSESTWIFPRELPGLDEGAARKEAARCLQCGLICYQKVA